MDNRNRIADILERNKNSNLIYLISRSSEVENKLCRVKYVN